MSGSGVFHVEHRCQTHIRLLLNGPRVVRRPLRSTMLFHVEHRASRVLAVV
jgi:hypothetical protein